MFAEIVNGLVQLFDKHGAATILLVFFALPIVPLIFAIYFFHRYVVGEAFNIFRHAVFGTLDQYNTHQNLLRQLLEKQQVIETKLDFLVQLLKVKEKGDNDHQKREIQQ